ncbi:MAG: hypothetical protein ACM3SW_08215 [Actinomycetota bacterium]
MRLYKAAATMLVSSLSIWCCAQSRATAPTGSAAPATSQAQLAKPDSSRLFAIDYRNGRVSLVAERAELGKVLEAIGKKIGASIEVAPDVASEPVVARIGPATPAQVLVQLLDGPKLEYIVIGSDDGGKGLKRVVVRRRNTFGREPLAAMKTQPGPSRR